MNIVNSVISSVGLVLTSQRLSLTRIPSFVFMYHFHFRNLIRIILKLIVTLEITLGLVGYSV